MVELIMRHGAVAELSVTLDRMKAQNILLVTGKKSFSSCGAEAAILPQLKARGCNVTQFNDFSPNPKLEELSSAITEFKGANYDCVVAVGGGSVMDTAKIINFFGCNDIAPESYIKNGASKVEGGKSFIAIPTTAGSGSEATHFAVLYIEGVKYSVAHASILPSTCIVDAALIEHLPPYIAACTAMDAMSQAIESFWSINATEESQGYSLKAIKLAKQALPDTVTQNTRDARVLMMEAAHYAGKAINIAKTTASHALSYPITSHFGVPHGHAVMMTLPEMLRYNAGATEDDLTHDKGIAYHQNMFSQLLEAMGESDADAAADSLTAIMKTIGLQTRFGELDISDPFVIATEVDPVRMKNNPRQLTADAIYTMLKNLL